MSGLFEKALALLDREREVIASAGGEVVFDEESGISKEDQREIIQEIEKAASRKKLAAGKEAFLIKAQKKGILMPVLVNALAVTLLAAGGFLLYYLFQRGESTLKEEKVVVASAEGMLIEELKRESEEKLLEKNREISQIQGRLEEIDQERRELAANMEAKVQAREQELRKGLEGVLAAEQEKMRQQGISEEDINRRLAALEAQKSTEFRRELDAFKRQAEEERVRTENNLKSLQQEYQASLAKANEERVKVLDDAKKREAELKSQLDAKTKALEAESREARQELSRIAEMQEKEQLASGQLVGLYNRVKADMQAGQLVQALKSLDGIRTYLNDPAIATLPSIQQRREVEFFVADSLSSLVKGEMKKAEVDTSSLIAAANLVTDLRNRIVEGDRWYARGEVTEAEKRYREALALIPEINKTHKYFLDKEIGTVNAAVAAEQALRQAKLLEGLAKAQAAYEARDFAGAVDAYAKAFAYLPEDPATIDRLVGEIRQAGFELAAEKQRKQDSAAAAAPLAEADRLFSQARYAEAIPAYIEVLGKYPAASQAKSALQGIGRSAEALDRQTRAGQGDAQYLTKQLADRNAEIEALEKDLQAKVALAETLQREKKMLSDEIEALKKAAAGAAAASAELDEATKQKLARLETIEVNYNKIIESYKQYATREDALLGSKGEAGLVEAKLHLNAFLASTEESFPGLWNRIKHYDSAFEKAGRTGALEDMNDVLYELSLRAKPQERQQYLEMEIERRRDDALMAGLLKELKNLQGGGSTAVRDMGSILTEVSLRKKPEARELYLETEIVKNRSNPEMVGLLEKLLNLLRPGP